ncbi:hypothetical protein [Bacillus salacetis]|nr:hypothetical protein [Bacillus salacetis]
MELGHHSEREQRMMPEKRWNWGIISWQTENDAGKTVEMGHHFVADRE